VKSVSDSKLPFYYWENDTIGDAIVYHRVVSRSKIFKDNRHILDMLGMAVDVTIGDFKKASYYVNKKPSSFVDLTTVHGPIMNWVPSLIFAGALTADRLDNSDLKIELMELIVKMRAKLKPVSMKFFSTYLAAEFALMVRDQERAIEIIKGFDLATGKSKPEFVIKLPLLHLLSLLQYGEMSAERFKTELDNYQAYMKHPAVKADYGICLYAARLLQGDYSITKSDVSRIIKSNYAAEDLCYRILVDALTYSIANDLDINGEVSSLLRALNLKVSNTLVSSQLKQKLIAFKLIKGIKSGKPVETIDEILATHKINNLLIYPKLLLLKYAYRVRAKELTAEKAISSYKVFTDGSCSISAMECNAAKLLRVDTSSSMISEMIRKGSHRTAVWAGIAAFVAVKPYSFDKFSKIVHLLRDNSEKFTWQERILLNIASE